MSHDAETSSFSRPIAARRDGCEPLAIFVSQALNVAQATDPMLAGLLSGMIGNRGSDLEGDAWRGDRRAGLELCRRLLLYVREDVADRRLDVSLGYIEIELAAIASPRQAAATH